MNPNNKISKKTATVKSAKKQVPKTQPKSSKKVKATSSIVLNDIARMKRLAQEIAMSLAAPGEAGTRACRWANQMSQKRTALASPFEKLNADFGQGAVANDELANSDDLIVIKRVAECAAIIYQQNQPSNASSYLWQMQGNLGKIEGSVVFPIPGQQIKNVKVPYAIANPDPAYTFRPHGDVLYAGSVTGSSKRFVWLDKGDALSMNIEQASGSNVDVTFIIDRYSTLGLQEQYNSIATTVITGVPLVQTLKSAGDPSGYYAISIASKAANPVTFQINSLASGNTDSSFGHRALPDFSSNVGRVQGVRVLAASAMFTNTSPVTDLSGSVTGYQFGDSDDWFDLIGTDLAAKVQSAQDSTTMDIRNGMHGFLLPTQPRDFLFKTDIEIDSAGNVVDSKYPLDDQGSFLVLVPSSKSAPGCQGIITLRYTVEYLSKNTWADLEASDVPSQAYDLALDHLKRLPQFNPNAFHLKELWNSIVGGAKKAFSWATTELPKYLQTAKTIGEILAV